MRPGELIAGRYRVDRSVGEGGMGTVFQARDESGRVVAIKTLLRQGIAMWSPDEAAGGDIQMWRFQREVEALARVYHPAIVRSLDHGKTAEGVPFLVLEWLAGHDLSERLAEGPLSVEATVALATQLLGALEVAHRAGVVHRDVKPSNVFLVGGDPARPKLLDFGLARLVNSDLAATVTASGSLVGTPAYLAPEQARGETVDGRADLFSLGCLLFECLAGRRAFRGENPMAVLAKVLLETPPEVVSLRPDVPAWLSRLVTVLLYKGRDRRPPSASAVSAALRSRDVGAALVDLGERRDVGPEAGPSSVPTTREVTLTGDERRLVSVVLMSAKGIPAAEDAQGAAERSSHQRSADSATQLLGEMGWRVSEYGAQMQCLATGDVVLVVDGAGVATDRVRLAVRGALALARAQPGAAISVATGHGQFEGEFPVGEVIDRAGEGLHRVAGQVPRTGDGSSISPAIAVDDLTTGLLDGRFEISGDEEQGLFLTGERHGGSFARRLLGRTTPFVGRGREVRLLDALLESAFAGEGAQVAVVTGPPGAGKSRLAVEQMERWREAGREIWCGHGDVMHSGAAWSLLAALVADAMGAQEGEDESLRLRKLRARLGRYLGPPEVDRLAPFLAEVAGVRSHEDIDEDVRLARRDRELMADRIRSAWIEWLGAEVRARPLVLVLEDVHWGDLPTIRTLDATLRELGDQPLLLVAFGRPQVTDRFPHLWQEWRPTRIELQRLREAACEDLVREMLGPAASASEVSGLVSAADGNPFFLEELIRGHAEGRRDQAPPTLLAMVQVRLEELASEDRRLLRAAAVFGQVFWRGGVETLRGRAIEPGRIQRLVDLELVARRAHSTYHDTDELTFRHSLVREAAYASLTREDRLLGHRLAGEWLESREGSAAVLLEHFRRAEALEKVQLWLPRAATEAFEAHDFDAAIRLADEGVKHLEGPAAGRLHLLCAAAQRWRGDWNETQRRASAAGELLTPGTADWFRAGAEAITAAARRGDQEVAERWQALVASTEAEIETRDDDNQAVWLAGSARITALSLAARQVFHSGDYAEAERLAAIAESIAEPKAKAAKSRAGVTLDPAAWADLHRLRGAQARHVGDLAGDLEGYRRALEACEILGDVRQAANVRVSMGFAYLEVGDQNQAEAYLSRGLREASRIGLESVATRARQNWGLSRIQRGDAAGALKVLQQVIREAEEQGNLRFVGWTSIYLAMAHLIEGNLDGAESAARRAAALLADAPPARAGADAVLARALVRRGQTTEARQVAASAMEVLCARGGIEEFESLVRLAWLEALEAAGDETLAVEVREAADRLQVRAAALRDGALRRSFLSGVPENRRLLEWFRTAGIEIPVENTVEDTMESTN